MNNCNYFNSFVYTDHITNNVLQVKKTKAYNILNIDNNK